MKAISFLCCMFMMQFSFAQYADNDYSVMPKYDLPKSPNASSFERYVSVPGNYQTGQVSPTIPLLSFTVDGLTVPLMLNYSNTGLKVSDIASWVGLGWNLQVGGTITQEVRGIPDDGDKGLMTAFYAQRIEQVVKNELRGFAKWQYFNDVLKSFADTEHDIFTYDVLGVHGKFYINKFDKCIQTPNSNHKITFTLASNKRLETFTIVDDKGNTYYFRTKEESVITSVSPARLYYYNKLNGNTWYLSEIATINGEKILFEYDHYTYTKNDVSESQTFYPVGSDCYTNVSSVPEQTKVGTLINVYQPTRIRWKNGFINFMKGSNRSDLQLISESAQIPFLSGVEMYETPDGLATNQGKLVKKNTFEYLNNSRLFLKKVNFGITVANRYEFKYINEGEDSLFPGYSYPQRGATAIDYWGYYNGAVNNPGFLPYDAVSAHPLVDRSYTGILIGIAPFAGRNNRIPNPEFAAYGMLSEIRYPTGGKSVFFYEGNVVRKDKILNQSSETPTLLNTLISSTNSKNDAMVTLGGIRIRKVQFYSDTRQQKPSKETIISYDTSEIYTGFMPLFYSYLFREKFNCSVCQAKYSFTLNSNSILSNPAPVVQYGAVEESNGVDNTIGKTVYEYDPATLGRGGYADAPYVSALYSSWREGLRKTSEVKTNEVKIHVNELQKVNNNYVASSVDNYLNKYGYDLKIALIRDDQGVGTPGCSGIRYSTQISPLTEADAEEMANAMFKWETSGLPSDNYVLRSTVDTIYDGSSPFSKKVAYNFHNEQRNLLLPNSTYTFDSKGDSLITLFTYPQDYFSADPNLSLVSSDPKVNGMLNLLRKNIQSVPVEKISVINKNGIRYVISADLFIFNADRPTFSTIYRASLSSPIPLSAFTKSSINSTNGSLVFDSRYKPEKEYHLYNPLNQVLEFAEKKNGTPHSLIWDYNSTHQIADVVNASYTDIAYTSFEAEGSGNWNIASSARVPSGGFSGKKYYGLSNTETIDRSGLSANKQYILSYWTLGNEALNISGTIAGYTLKGAALNGWTYYEHIISGVNAVTLSSAIKVGIDELRLYPFDAQMTTYTYNPLIGMTSTVNAKNQIIYYEYDDMLRLTIAKDQQGNVLQRTDYHYQEFKPNSRSYYDEKTFQLPPEIGY